MSSRTGGLDACETHEVSTYEVMTSKTKAEPEAPSTAKTNQDPQRRKPNAANERVEAFTAAGVKDTGESWSLCGLGLEKFMHRQLLSSLDMMLGGTPCSSTFILHRSRR